MPVIRHADQPTKLLQRAPITSRSLVTTEVGATASALWEQFMPPGVRIHPHYHDVEEIITILSGMVTVTLGDETQIVSADTTLFIPPYLIHSLENTGTEVVRTLAFFPSIAPQLVYTDIRAITTATRAGDVAQVDALLAADGDLVDCYEPDTGERLLHLAVLNNNSAMVDLLLRYGADVRLLNRAGQTPLALAHTLKHDTLVPLLQQPLDVGR